MPSRNTIKTYSEDSYYHVYNRGVNKMPIFLDKQDYSVFLNLLKRYLGGKPAFDRKGREYPWLHNEIELITYCLMPNHFHLFVYQHKKESMTKLLRGVCSSYTVYFNKRYERVGPLFQGKYKASLILDESYYLHISRYIHLNPKDYMNWEWSSLKYYLGVKSASWLTTGSVMEQFNFDTDEYLKFLKDYSDYRESLADLGPVLAG